MSYFSLNGSFRQHEEHPNNMEVAVYFECQTYSQKDAYDLCVDTEWILYMCVHT